MSTLKLGAQIDIAGEPELARARRLTEAFLEEALSSGRFGPGARLPTERALSQQLQVPRSAVRNAFSRLEAVGKVVRITGSGTYVAERESHTEHPAAVLPSFSLESSPLEIMETRLLIEPRLARLVVAHATRTELDYLQECLNRGEEADSLAGFEEWDTRLHQAIAEASHNRLMISLYGMITAARDQIEWGELKRRSLNGERRAVLEGQHRLIVDALKSRDADRAELAAREHLRTVHENLLGHAGHDQVPLLPR